MSRIFVFCLLLSLAACSNESDGPDVSGIKVDVTIERFDQAFFAADSANLQALRGAAQKFPDFYPFFMNQILQLPAPEGQLYAPEAAPVLAQVLSSYRPVYDTVQQQYRNMSGIEEDIEEGFRHVKYYYPQYAVPRIVTYLGTFDAPGLVLTPRHIGIGLHQYAGSSFSAYQLPEIQQLYPAYISRRFDPAYLAPNVLKAVVDDLYPDSSAGRPLIEQMIEKGKQWFLLHRFLPGTHDSLKTGYTGRQLAWAEENEGNIWSYLLRENLYTIDPVTVQNYIGEAPFTANMPESSPGNIGQWVGWRIVEAFAGRNDELTVQQVLATPARDIFNRAQYKPK